MLVCYFLKKQARAHVFSIDDTRPLSVSPSLSLDLHVRRILSLYYSIYTYASGAHVYCRCHVRTVLNCLVKCK